MALWYKIKPSTLDQTCTFEMTAKIHVQNSGRRKQAGNRNIETRMERG
jgi:hypothetical protein